MPLEIRFDDPEDLEIKRPISKIKGWCAADVADDLVGLEFQIAGQRVPYRRMPRPDVEEARLGKSVRGFLMDLDLSQHLAAVHKRGFVMQAIGTGTEPMELRFRVSGEALARCLETAVGS